MTTGKTIALTRRTFVGKVMSLLFNTPSSLVITFLPRSITQEINLAQSHCTCLQQLSLQPSLSHTPPPEPPLAPPPAAAGVLRRQNPTPHAVCTKGGQSLKTVPNFSVCVLLWSSPNLSFWFLRLSEHCQDDYGGRK